MSKNRLFKNQPKIRLIVSVEGDTVEIIDELIGKPLGGRHPAKGNRSEFVRLAIEEKLERDMVQFQNRAQAIT
ncbi:ribbon-helix-helix domain-containing protein [Pseudomonas sp. S2_D06]